MAGAERLKQVPSKRDRISEDEWEARLDLAAAYRLVAHHGWTHLINNHITVRVPGTMDQFLINPYGYLYEQITASSLVKIDVDGNILDDTPYEVNRAGFVIHSAVHMARPDLHAIIHTHTVAGQAVSALDCGLLPLNQAALRFYNRVGYHDHEGISHDLSERDRIVRDLGPHKVLIMRNHGLLTAGLNIAEAFHLMYQLEKACQTQMMVLASNQPYSTAPPEICEKAAQQFHRGNRALGQQDWPALRELVDTLYPAYKN
jgi:ribulose-5-phosphate 4-epimerase/fuculose-1-phosphate aldolase